MNGLEDLGPAPRPDEGPQPPSIQELEEQYEDGYSFAPGCHCRVEFPATHCEEHHNESWASILGMQDESAD